MVAFAAAHRLRDGVSFVCLRSAPWFASETARSREVDANVSQPGPALHAVRFRRLAHSSRRLVAATLLELRRVGNSKVRSVNAWRASMDGHIHSSESGMKSIGQLLSPADILLDLDVSTKTRVFEEVGRLFEQRHGLLRAQVVEGLSARETLGSTGLGLGIALPHARIKNLSQPMAAFVRLKLPIPFDAPDAKPVSHLVIFLAPEHATEHHLQILAEVAQM